MNLCAQCGDVCAAAHCTNARAFTLPLRLFEELVDITAPWGTDATFDPKRPIACNMNCTSTDKVALFNQLVFGRFVGALVDKGGELKSQLFSVSNCLFDILQEFDLEMDSVTTSCYIDAVDCCRALRLLSDDDLIDHEFLDVIATLKEFKRVSFNSDAHGVSILTTIGSSVEAEPYYKVGHSSCCRFVCVSM